MCIRECFYLKCELPRLERSVVDISHVCFLNANAREFSLKIYSVVSLGGCFQHYLKKDHFLF